MPYQIKYNYKEGVKLVDDGNFEFSMYTPESLEKANEIIETTLADNESIKEIYIVHPDGSETKY